MTEVCFNLAQNHFAPSAQQQQAQQPEASRDRVGNEGYVPKGTSASDLERLLGGRNQQFE